MIIEVFLLFVALFLFWFKTRKPSSMPPGSYGWPILGTLPSGKISISEHMKQLQQKYGNIFTTKWGSHPMVVLTDFNLIKKAFQHPDLQGRPLFLSMKMVKCNANQGQRFDIDDPKAHQYSTYTQEILECMQKHMLVLDILPFLQRILPTFVQNKVMKVDQAAKSIDGLYKMSERFIMEHLETLDPDNPRDIIDQFILQQAERKPDGSLTDADKNNLAVIMMDMFHAGSETTSSTLRWMILYMATHPEIQTKVQEHLDEVVPTTRLPGLGDRSRLPYVDAMLQEVLRLSSLAATSLLHRATADVSFEGYVIPKDAIVVACSKLCHRDSSAWQHSDEFHPEHFLNENGELAGKKDNFLPFSIGRRQCLGESLARMELYMFGTAILQRFRIEPPEGVTLSLDVNPEQIIASQPLPYKVVLKRRI